MPEETLNNRDDVDGKVSFVKEALQSWTQGTLQHVGGTYGQITVVLRCNEPEKKMLNEVLNDKAMLDSYEEEIATATAKIADIKAALLQKVRDGIDALIQESGLTRDEVLGVPTVTAQKGVTVTRETRTYALKSDPTKLYRRGRLPGWLRDAMRVAGHSPESPDAREAFRAEHMIEQAS